MPTDQEIIVAIKEDSQRGFGQLIFPKNGFKIQPPIFLILNPIFELLRGVFWKNKLTKSPSGICQGILHSISSILTYYGPQTDIPIKSYTRLKLKKFSVKNQLDISQLKNIARNTTTNAETYTKGLNIRILAK